jgi:superfamily II DNA or RNA helicase
MGEIKLKDKLKSQKPLYSLPGDDITKHVIVPALSVATNFRLMSGYFSIKIIRDLAPGLFHYISKPNSVLKVLVSPELSESDQALLKAGGDLDALAIAKIEEAFTSPQLLESALAKHATECLAYLLSQGRLEIRVVLMTKGMFHPKTWIFQDGESTAVLSGSANATEYGLEVNIEQLDLNRSWEPGNEKARCETHIEFFDGYWNSTGNAGSKTVTLEYAMLKGLLKPKGDGKIPDQSDYERALAEEFASQSSEDFDEREASGSLSDFRIPNTLEWETGLFKHQGLAVKAWEKSGRKAILEMATGAGKTITSLIAAQRLAHENGKLFIIATAPTKVLVEQWAQDFRRFGLSPYMGLGKNQKTHIQNIASLLEAIEYGFSEVESAIVTHDFIKNPDLANLLNGHAGQVLLIGDEVHNLGTTSFLDVAPLVDYRLGLTATLERQYDADGSEGLRDYFGKVEFTFSLEDAIGVCLVPYDYHFAEVTLTPDEMDEYIERTKAISKLIASSGGEPKGGNLKRLNILYKLRRKVLESASSKINELEVWLSRIPDSELHHTLIYCTASNPKQLESVNKLLARLGIRFYQVTQTESSGRLVGSILTNFRRGELKVLTAKKVLDEGFNVPEIRRAFLLASSAVEREWTQRRGRVLRLSDGKQKAEIIDFVALPLEGYLDLEGEGRFVKPELTRLEEFRRLAQNSASPGGTNEKLASLLSRYNVTLNIAPTELGDDGASIDAEEDLNEELLEGEEE